jgi:hypothetical protein
MLYPAGVVEVVMPVGAELLGVQTGGGVLTPVGLAGLPVSVIGQTVVPTETVSVVTWPTGHCVTVGAQEVMV